MLTSWRRKLVAASTLMQTVAMCHNVFIILLANVDVRYCTADSLLDLSGVLKFGVSSVGSMGPFWKFLTVSMFKLGGAGAFRSSILGALGHHLSVMAAVRFHFVRSGGLLGAMGGSAGTLTAI